jgi:hypothetical protein
VNENNEHHASLLSLRGRGYQSAVANDITMGSKIRLPRPQIRLPLAQNRPCFAKLGYVSTMCCHSQIPWRERAKVTCQPHSAAVNDITMGSKIRLPRPQIRLHLGQNRPCCAKLGYISTMCCHSRAQSPSTSTNHANHMARHETDSTSMSTRVFYNCFHPYVTRHLHTAHHCNTTQGRFK